MVASLRRVCFGMASCAWVATIGAQSLPAPAGNEQYSTVLRLKVYSCVDLSDELARPRIQDESCRWPMYELPRAAASAPSRATRGGPREPAMPSFGGSPCSRGGRMTLHDTRGTEARLWRPPRPCAHTTAIADRSTRQPD